MLGLLRPTVMCLLSVCMAAAAAEPQRPFTIVTFGDSTTNVRPGAVEKVYSLRIEEALAEEGRAIRVINRGVGGDHTDRARKRLEKDVLSEAPDLVVIQFGINDSAVDVWKNPPAKGPRVPRDRYRENLHSMIEELRKRDIAVILMTPNPLRWTERIRQRYGKPPYDPSDPLGFEKPHFRGHVAALRALARELEVPLVDIHAAYAEREKTDRKAAETFLLDGMHPNDAGHALVAEQLLPEIRKVMTRATP